MQESSQRLFVAVTVPITAGIVTFASTSSAGRSLLLCKDRLAGKLDLIAFFSDALHHDLLTFLELVTNVLDASIRDLRDVQQTIEAREDLDKCAKVDDTRNRSEIRFTDLSLGRKRLDTCDGPLSGFAVGGRDKNCSVIRYIDLRTGLFGDRADR
jgi:hypothetical protein